MVLSYFVGIAIQHASKALSMKARRWARQAAKECDRASRLAHRLENRPVVGVKVTASVTFPGSRSSLTLQGRFQVNDRASSLAIKAADACDSLRDCLNHAIENDIDPQPVDLGLDKEQSDDNSEGGFPKVSTADSEAIPLEASVEGSSTVDLRPSTLDFGRDSANDDEKIEKTECIEDTAVTLSSRVLTDNDNVVKHELSAHAPDSPLEDPGSSATASPVSGSEFSPTSNASWADIWAEEMEYWEEHDTKEAKRLEALADEQAAKRANANVDPKECQGDFPYSKQANESGDAIREEDDEDEYDYQMRCQAFQARLMMDTPFPEQRATMKPLCERRFRIVRQPVEHFQPIPEDDELHVFPAHPGYMYDFDRRGRSSRLALSEDYSLATILWEAGVEYQVVEDEWEEDQIGVAEIEEEWEEDEKEDEELEDPRSYDRGGASSRLGFH